MTRAGSDGTRGDGFELREVDKIINRLRRDYQIAGG